MRRAARAGSLCVAAAAGLVSVGGAADVAAQPRSARTVLTIHRGAESFPSNPVIDAAIREALLSRVDIPIDYFTEYLDPEPLAAAAASQALAGYMASKYAGQHVDVVIAVTDQSLRFVLDHRADLFPDAPIVYMGLSTPDAAIRTSGPGVTGVQVSNAYGQTLSAALAMHPGTERVYVVANAPDAVQVAQTHSELAASSGGVPLVFLDQGSVSKLVDAARAVPRHSLILFMWHTPEDPGNLLYSDRIAQRVADVAPVPVYGTSDFYIGLGLVGGVVRSTRESGARLGDLAGRILSGERAADIPIEAARVVPTFDWRQLRRWGVDPSLLPAGSDVQFRVPTAWESYRPYIVGTIAVVSAQLVLIMALVAARARARRAEATVRTREMTVRTSYDRIRHLAGRLIHAQEATRATVARDLHDGVCQDLAGLSIAIAGLRRSSGDLQDAPVQEELGKIQEDARNTYDEIRRLSHDLHPSTLRLLGIATALKAHCAEISKRNGVHVAFNVDGHLGSLEPDVAVSLFRIAQESLRNGIVHGKARSLSVSLTRSAEWIEMTVTDDGGGFDVERVRGSGTGLGLVSMEERAHAFGGDVHVESRPGQGTVTRVRCPAAAAGAGVSTAAG